MSKSTELAMGKLVSVVRDSGQVDFNCLGFNVTSAEI